MGDEDYEGVIDVASEQMLSVLARRGKLGAVGDGMSSCHQASL